MTLDDAAVAQAYSYAWWLTGNDTAARAAVLSALDRPELAAAGDAIRTEVLLGLVRGNAVTTATMCPASELALLHDGIGLGLDSAALLTAIDGRDAATELAHGRLEALGESHVQISSPERLGGLAVGNPADVAATRQSPELLALREQIMKGRDELVGLSTIAMPDDFAADVRARLRDAGAGTGRDADDGGPSTDSLMAADWFSSPVEDVDTARPARGTSRDGTADRADPHGDAEGLPDDEVDSDGVTFLEDITGLDDDTASEDGTALDRVGPVGVAALEGVGTRDGGAGPEDGETPAADAVDVSGDLSGGDVVDDDDDVIVVSDPVSAAGSETTTSGAAGSQGGWTSGTKGSGTKASGTRTSGSKVSGNKASGVKGRDARPNEEIDLSGLGDGAPGQPSGPRRRRGAVIWGLAAILVVVVGVLVAMALGGGDTAEQDTAEPDEQATLDPDTAGDEAAPSGQADPGADPDGDPEADPDGDPDGEPDPTVVPSPEPTPTATEFAVLSVVLDQGGEILELGTSLDPFATASFRVTYEGQQDDDQLQVTWTADGAPFATEVVDLLPDRPDVTFTEIRPTSGWPPGVHDLEFVLVRTGDVVATYTFTVS